MQINGVFCSLAAMASGSYEDGYKFLESGQFQDGLSFFETKAQFLGKVNFSFINCKGNQYASTMDHGVKRDLLHCIYYRV